MAKIVAYSENDSKKKNHNATSGSQVSRDTFPIKEPGCGQKVDNWFTLFNH